MPLPAIQAETHTVAQAAADGANQAIVIGVPVLLLVLIVYLCRHHKHKASTALLGFIAGVLLAGTAIGAGLANGAADLIVSAFGAIGSLFSGS